MLGTVAKQVHLTKCVTPGTGTSQITPEEVAVYPLKCFPMCFYAFKHRKWTNVCIKYHICINSKKNAVLSKLIHFRNKKAFAVLDEVHFCFSTNQSNPQSNSFIIKLNLLFAQ